MGLVHMFPQTFTVQVVQVTQWTLERGAIEGHPVLTRAEAISDRVRGSPSTNGVSCEVGATGSSSGTAADLLNFLHIDWCPLYINRGSYIEMTHSIKRTHTVNTHICNLLRTTSIRS